MLIAVILPFSDLRGLLDEGFCRLERPEWPVPQPFVRHMRGIGGIEPRNLKGFEGWVGEDRLVIGLPGATLRLPRALPAAGLTRIRLIRKACFFDGLMNGRFEFLFNVELGGRSSAAIAGAVNALLQTRLVVASTGFDGPILKAASAFARLWGESSVKRGGDAKIGLINARRPFCVVEAEEQALEREAAADESVAVSVELYRDQHVPATTECFLIAPRKDVATGRQSQFRREARIARTYMARLLQNIEGLAVFLGKAKVIDEDQIQFIFNEYTRQISRSRQRLAGIGDESVVGYCYSMFDKILPGKIQSVRTNIAASKIRPNVKLKVLTLLDVMESSNIANVEVKLGDEYKGIRATGDGIAIGRNATAQSVKIGANKEGSLSEALMWFADQVRASGQADASIQVQYVENAAKQAKEGTEDDAWGWLKKSAGWVLDLAKTAGSAVLEAFVKSKLGLP